MYPRLGGAEGDPSVAASISGEAAGVDDRREAAKLSFELLLALVICACACACDADVDPTRVIVDGFRK